MPRAYAFPSGAPDALPGRAMIARLDRLLQRLGQDVVVQSQVAVLPGPGERGQPATRMTDCADLYERHVFSALKAVTPEERECLELTYFDALSVGDIAIRCGMSIEAVEDRLGRGLEDMLRHLRAHE